MAVAASSGHNNRYRSSSIIALLILERGVFKLCGNIIIGEGIRRIVSKMYSRVAELFFNRIFGEVMRLLIIRVFLVTIIITISVRVNTSLII